MITDLKEREKGNMEKVWDVRYPCYVEYDPETGTYGGFCVDLPVYVAGKPTFEEAKKALEDGVAYYLAHLEVEGRPFPKPSTGEEEVRGDHLTRVEVQPSPVNPVSIEIEKAMRRKGISRSELARRMGVRPPMVTRILDPLYFGHTLTTLRRVAKALESDLEVRFVA